MLSLFQDIMVSKFSLVELDKMIKELFSLVTHVTNNIARHIF